MNLKQILGFLFISIAAKAIGNNIQISNVQFIDSLTVTCDLQWENSWNTPNQEPFNFDAVWLFAKNSWQGGPFRPLTFDLSNQYTSNDSLTEVYVPNDQLGVFVKRIGLGHRSMVSTQLQLKFSEPLYGGEQIVQLFGIEMVCVPEGPFQLGDSASTNSFKNGVSGGPVRISQAAPLNYGSTQNTLAFNDTLSLELPATFPVGYTGFYCMKYEISQQQYCDFLNCLEFEQQDARTTNDADKLEGHFAFTGNTIYRNGIKLKTAGSTFNRAVYGLDANDNLVYNELNDGQHRAMNFIHSNDVLAYLDWAGLRPITELEFEKAARGFNASIPGEFAWGTPNVIDANTALYDGFPNETVQEQATSTAGLANHGYFGLNGPLRGGFAATQNSTKIQAGASYFGVFELSGNVWEVTISAARNDAVGFDGDQHGDGILTNEGDANVPTWPNHNGVMYRGGASLSGIGAVGTYRDLAISDRYYLELIPNERKSTTGGRGGRSAY